MGFLKSIVKLGGWVYGGWAGGLLADKHSEKVGSALGFATLGLGGGLLVKDALKPKFTVQANERVMGPGDSARFVDRRDPNQPNELDELGLPRDLDVFRIPLINLLQKP